MDPNETLKCAKAALREMREADKAGDDEDRYMLAAADVAEYFEALDEWLSKGGFLPADWDAMRPARQTMVSRWNTEDE